MLNHDGRGNRMFGVGYNMIGGIIPEDYQLKIRKFFDNCERRSEPTGKERWYMPE